ncbi:MAG: hypothetical protein J6J42_03165 [Lachnospiraceae bacterium]|nr:hypothetical protein [Lachnospiraceae bacterium]
MYGKLEGFIQKVPEFLRKSSSEMIIYFVYYCLYIENLQQVQQKQIEECYSVLSVKPYSNIPAYLSSHSKGKNAIFLKNKIGYTLERSMVDKIKNEVSEEIEVVVMDELLPLDILDTAPYYIKLTAKQMNQCFECCLYDAVLVMMRKLVETLIIECFERYGIDENIKDDKGQFFFLSELIPRFISSDKWNVSRNLESYIKMVKKYGDLSAHNRRFLAKKSDMNDFKFEMRQVVQEIIMIIDYKNWNREK